MAACAHYGCTRPECRDARRRVNRELYAERKKGLAATVPASEAAEHVAMLVKSGMSSADIAGKSGVGATQIQRLAKGDLDRILRVNSDAILGVSVPAEDWVSMGATIDAVGARRRLQALGVQGFPASFISEETGMSHRTISELRSGGRRRVLISRLRLVSEAHDRFWDDCPLELGVSVSSFVRTRGWAKKSGWLPTEVWADIDDPDCKPVIRTPRYVSLTEDARELMNGQGYTSKHAAERLGVKHDTLKQAIVYHDRVVAKSS
jgi:transcriptional regulator with XRE-family HTH domain